MARRRRTVEVFTLSFLDCICCGFGAVILFYTIVSAQAGVRTATQVLSAEADRLAQQVSAGTRYLAVLRNEIDQAESETASDAARVRSIASALASRQQQVSTYDSTSLARRAHIQQLEADIKALEDGKRRLEAASLDKGPPGQQVSSFRATGGDRRYITGIRLHGKRILILVDSSASMLHEDLVTILRLRNADDEQKRNAAKWRRAVETVSWLTTQVPPASEYQIYTFNTHAQPLLPDSAGKWIDAGDAPQLARGVANLHKIVPADGTSLYNAFAAARTLTPLPDQIVLITDGLPTQGKTAGLRKYVDSAARLRLFDAAVGQLPDKVPVDTILLPMKGDTQAAHRFWELARLTDGTLLMPAKDWP
ncbi:MAG TPA: vWA domain-containing protein [Steroidobacteraceae bacterium]|nr:vWA domain-containing protein [Steroidobacteraceae bacterium]